MQHDPFDLAAAHGSGPAAVPGDSPPDALAPLLPAREASPLRPALAISAAALLAWALIVATVGLQLWLMHAPPGAMPSWIREPLQRHAERSEFPPELRPNMELEMLARVHTGLKLWMAALPQGSTATASTRAQSIRELDQTARSAADKLRLVPVAAELIGPERALERVDLLLLEGELPAALHADAHALRTIYRDGPEALGPARREALRQRHRWFGDLALSHGLPAQDPQRRAATGPAFRAVAALVAAGAGTLVIGVASLALAVTAIVLATRGKLRSAYRAQPDSPDSDAPASSGSRRSAYLEAFALYLFTFLGFSVTLELLGWPLSAIWLYLLGVPLVVLWPRLRGQSWRAWREGMGLHRGRGVLREMAAGVGGYIAGLPIIAMGLVLTLMLLGMAKLWDDLVGTEPGASVGTEWVYEDGEELRLEQNRDGEVEVASAAARRAAQGGRLVRPGPVPAVELDESGERRRRQPPKHPIADEIASGLSGGKVLVLFLLATVWAPLVEETMFRGALYHHVRQRFGWLLSGVLVGVLFAAVHPQGLLAIPALASIALVFAALREWRGSLIAPVTAHALNNGVLLALLVLLVG